MATALLPGQQQTVEKLAELLRLEDFSAVYAEADRVRRENVGDRVQIRAILEFSNHCRRQCRYCGLNRNNTGLERYRIQPVQMVETARQAWEAGYRTIVLQSGEDDTTPRRYSARWSKRSRRLAWRSPSPAESSRLRTTPICVGAERTAIYSSMRRRTPSFTAASTPAVRSRAGSAVCGRSNASATRRGADL